MSQALPILKNITLLPPLLIAALFLTAGCHQDAPSSKFTWHFFSARDNGNNLDRPILYRAKTPLHWTKKEPSPVDSIADTKKSICEFYILDNEGSIRIVLHTFPTTSGLHIPAGAQISRWQKQFEELSPEAMDIKPSCRGGFSGLFFEGSGLLHGKPATIMGWSMQLAPMYEKILVQSNQPVHQYQCADFTIKATGPTNLIAKYRTEIIAFANTFELIEELPFSW